MKPAPFRRIVLTADLPEEALARLESTLVAPRRSGPQTVTSLRRLHKRLAGMPPLTAVCLKLRNPLSPLLDPGWLEAALLRQFATLFDPGFDELLADAYPRPPEFRVNGRAGWQPGRGHWESLPGPEVIRPALAGLVDMLQPASAHAIDAMRGGQ